MTVTESWQFVARQLPEHLLYFVVEHAAEVELPGERHVLSAGSAMWLVPGVEHTLRLVDPARPITLYYFRFRVVADGAGRGPAESVLIRHHVWELRDLAAHFYDDNQLAGPWRNDRLRTLLYLIYTGLLRAPGQAGGPNPRHPLGYGARRRLEEYAANHLADWPAPADLAAILHLSPDYFARAFRRTYGISPRSWLLRERMRVAAARLAESSLTITEVASGLGYRDLSLFSRQFRQVIGVSPRHYRAR